MDLSILDWFTNSTFKLYSFFIMLGIILWTFYSIVIDFIRNNDPDGRIQRSNDRKRRRKQKILRRLRKELKLQKSARPKWMQKKEHDNSTNNNNRNRPSFMKDSDESVAETTASEIESIQHEIEEINIKDKMNQQEDYLAKWSKMFWEFFSDEVVVPESDTDEEYGSNSAFVSLPDSEKDAELISSWSYRRARISIIRHGHTWDPAL